jgi:biotin carboxylase
VKKIMILGAGIYQVPLIKKAKAMGLWTIVVSYRGNYPGFQLADQIFEEDTTNAERILEIAKAEEIDGIITTGTDVAVRSIGKVATELKLCGLSYESALLVSDKLKMKDAFLRHGVRTARYLEARSLKDAKTIYHALNKPVIFKAVDSSGSRGIVKVSAEGEVEAAFQEVRKVTKLDYFLIEEFIEGDEFGAQALVANGKTIFCLPHGDFVYMSKSGVPIGHFAPYEMKQTVLDDMNRQMGNAIAAMRLDHCAINADFILRGDEVYVLEIGARAGATCLPELVSIYYRCDYYEQIIRVALGESPRMNMESAVPNASLLLMSDKTGRIVRQVNNNPADERICDISFDYHVGDQVRKFQVGPDRIGQVIVKGQTLRETIELLEQVKNRITIKVLPEEPMSVEDGCI